MSSRMAGFERDSLIAVWNSKRVWLLHVFANAVLFAAFFYWLRIPDERCWQVAISALVGAAVLFCTLWLHSATLDYFNRYHRRDQPSFSSSMSAAITRVPAFLVWALIFSFVLWFIGNAWDYDAQVGGWTRHVLPMFLRKHLSPRNLTSAAFGIVWFVAYWLWPIAFLPVGAQVAKFNFRGFFGGRLVDAFRPLRELRFWGVYIAAFVLGVYAPYKLVSVTPKINATLHYQTASMAARFGVAYLLIVTAWLVVASAIARTITGGLKSENLSSEQAPTAPVATLT